MEQAFKLKNTVLLMALAAAYPLQAHALAGMDVCLEPTQGRLC